MGPSGWFVFYQNGTHGLAQHVGNDAKPIGMPVAVPTGASTATASGYAVLFAPSGDLFRLGPDLQPAGSPIKLVGKQDGMAASGDVLSFVGSGVETRLDPSDKSMETSVADPSGVSRMAVAPRKGSFGVVWSSTMDSVLRFRAVDGASQAGPVLRVGCTHAGPSPSVAATSGGFLVAMLGPEDPYWILYHRAYPTLRVSRVQQP